MQDVYIILQMLHNIIHQSAKTLGVPAEYAVGPPSDAKTGLITEVWTLKVPCGLWHQEG